MEALPQDKVRHCSFPSCPEDALTMCHKCNKWFCLEHASELEPAKYCIECRPIEDAALDMSPIVDAEGVRHSGKVIRPVGIVFSQNSKLIHEMTDDELKEYIRYYQHAVHDCERSLDYARITLGNAIYVAGEREIARIKRETGEVYFPTPKKIHAVAKPRKAKAPANEADIAEFLIKNLTPAQLAAFMAKTQKKGA